MDSMTFINKQQYGLLNSDFINGMDSSNITTLMVSNILMDSDLLAVNHRLLAANH
jgi:hypothetical protein